MTAGIRAAGILLTPPNTCPLPGPTLFRSVSLSHPVTPRTRENVGGLPVDAGSFLSLELVDQPGAGDDPCRVTHCGFERAGQTFGSRPTGRGPRAARLLTVTLVDDDIATPAADDADLPIGRLTLSARFDVCRGGERIGGLPPTRLLSVADVVRQPSARDGHGGVRRLGAVIPYGIPSENRHRAGVAGRPGTYTPVVRGVVVRGSSIETVGTT